jgi:hypothetical protein
MTCTTWMVPLALGRVAGAFGHSRLREWVLGGMSRALMDQRDRCLLLSH